MAETEQGWRWTEHRLRAQVIARHDLPDATTRTLAAAAHINRATLVNLAADPPADAHIGTLVALYRYYYPRLWLPDATQPDGGRRVTLHDLVGGVKTYM